MIEKNIDEKWQIESQMYNQSLSAGFKQKPGLTQEKMVPMRA